MSGIHDIYIPPAPGEPGRVGLSRQVADSQQLGYRSGEIETLILPDAGTIYRDPRGMCFGDGKLWLGTNSVPGILIRFNNLDDLADRTHIAFPVDGIHGNLDSLTFANGWVWAIWCEGVEHLVVTRINPRTMEWADIADIPGMPAVFPSISADDEHLYFTTHDSGFGDGDDAALAVKVDQRTGAWEKLRLTGYTCAHCTCADGEFVYITARNINATNLTGLIRLDPSTSPMTFAAANFSTDYKIPTDSICAAGDYIFAGTETGTMKGLLRINKRTLAIDVLYKGHVCQGAVFDGTYVWAMILKTPGTATGDYLLRIDPQTLEIHEMQVGGIYYTGTRTLARMSTDGFRLFYLAKGTDVPAVLVRQSIPYLSGRSYISDKAGGALMEVSDAGVVAAKSGFKAGTLPGVSESITVGQWIYNFTGGLLTGKFPVD